MVSNAIGNIGVIGGSNSTGTVPVSGSGSTWNNSGNLVVGDNRGNGGNGQLTIQNGGMVSDATGSVGGSRHRHRAGDRSRLYLDEQRRSHCRQHRHGATDDPERRHGFQRARHRRHRRRHRHRAGDRPGSTWASNGDLLVGDNGGTGQLTIQNGGLVSNAYGNIGDGTVLVTGPGSTWTNSGNLDVGAFELRPGATDDPERRHGGCGRRHRHRHSVPVTAQAR